MALFLIMVKTLISGQEFEINVNPQHVIRSIKETLEKEVNISADEQILMYRGEYLDDNKSLDNFGDFTEPFGMPIFIFLEKSIVNAVDSWNKTKLYNILKGKSLLNERKNISNTIFSSEFGQNACLLRCIDIFTSAALAGFDRLVSLLLNMGLVNDVNSKDYNGWNAGHYASSVGSIKVLEVLFANGLDKEMKNKVVIAFENYKNYKEFFILYFIINFILYQGNETMIEIACLYYRRPVTILVPPLTIPIPIPIPEASPNSPYPTRLSTFTAKVQADERAKERLTAAHIHATALARAADLNRNVIRFLIQEKGCNINTRNSVGSALISYASGNSNLEVCKELISLECDLDIKDSYMDTPFLLACRKGHIEVCKLLLHARCNIYAKTEDGSSALMICCRYGQLDICKELLAIRFDTEITANNGDTALMVACKSNKIVFCKLLLEAGCNTNAINHYGNNALMYGGSEGHLEICKFLLSAGCDKEAKDGRGDTPFIHACRNGHLDVCKLLVDAGCDTEVKNNKGENALLLSSKYGRLYVCKFLLVIGIDISATDNGGSTALHLASKGNKFNIVKVLVDYGGADVLSVNSDGKTAQDLIPSWSTSRHEMNVFFNEAMEKRRDNGFKREMLADDDEEEGSVHEIEMAENNDGDDDQATSKKARIGK